MLSTLLTAVSIGTAWPQQPNPAAIADSDVRDALTTWDAYNQAMVGKDYAKLRDILSVPYLSGGPAPVVIVDLAEIVERLRNTRESLPERYGTSTASTPQVTVLSRNQVLVNCRIRHLAKDGSLIREQAQFYILIRLGSVWKLAGNIPQDPNYTGKLF
jgi:hypothetical protein